MIVGPHQHSQGLVPIPPFRQEFSQQTQKARDMSPVRRATFDRRCRHAIEQGRPQDRPSGWRPPSHGGPSHSPARSDSCAPPRGAALRWRDPARWLRFAADLMDPAVQIKRVAQREGVVKDRMLQRAPRCRMPAHGRRGLATTRQQRDETAREHPGLEAPLENRGHAVGRVVERKRSIKMIKGGCQIAAEEGGHAHHAMSHDDRRSFPCRSARQSTSWAISRPTFGPEE